MKKARRFRRARVLFGWILGLLLGLPVPDQRTTRPPAALRHRRHGSLPLSSQMDSHRAGEATN